MKIGQEVYSSAILKSSIVAANSNRVTLGGGQGAGCSAASVGWRAAVRRTTGAGVLRQKSAKNLNGKVSGVAYGLGVNGRWRWLWWGWGRRRVNARDSCDTDNESDESGNVGELHVDYLEMYGELEI